MTWEAWSAFIGIFALYVSVLGVLISAFAAIAVYMLGRETNRLAAVTRDIAQEDREREAQFILMTINADVLETVNTSRMVIEGFDEHVELFCSGDPMRSPLFVRLRDLDLHIEPSVLGRLHVLDRKTSLAIVRARAQLKLARLAHTTLPVYMGDRVRMRHLYGVIFRRVKAAHADLEYLLKVVGDALSY